MNCNDDNENDMLSQIIVIPALKSENNANGLCGKWRVGSSWNDYEDLQAKATNDRDSYNINRFDS